MAWTWYDATVEKIEDQTPTTKRFWLKAPPEFSFQAGQFITLDLPISERRRQRWRSYSIANAPNEAGLVELCVVRLDGGSGTEYLFEETQVGDTLKFKGPGGVFTLPATIEHDLVLICTGTGIAPFRAMLQDIQANNRTHGKLHLIFGTRLAEGLLYRDEMEALQHELEGFSYSVALSRETDLDSMAYHFPVYPGYVHQIYQRQYADVRPGVRFYLCGWSNMVDEARANLEQMGYAPEQIIYELYG